MIFLIDEKHVIKLGKGEKLHSGLSLFNGHSCCCLSSCCTLEIGKVSKPSEPLVRWSNSPWDTPASNTFPWSNWGRLCPTISVTFPNDTLFTLWLASSAEVRKEPGFELFSPALFFHSWTNYFCHFSCELSVTLWMFSRKHCLKISIITIFKQ